MKLEKKRGGWKSHWWHGKGRRKEDEEEKKERDREWKKKENEKEEVVVLNRRFLGTRESFGKKGHMYNLIETKDIWC